ncbi:MAG: Gfo/Idh/MocA family oxidoreductase [Actinomycetaceae bacterium]|nr:Gfo/Idh/MocA family oxidoreductase [Actinomycetaceae bacterium]
MMEKQTVGVGLVSLGWMGRLHTRSYKALAERFPELKATIQLVHCADPIETNQSWATDVLGYRRASADYRRVVADPAVDVVSICAPNYLHREIALAAAAAGKPFWIEKPMGIDAAESKDIAVAAQEAELVTAVGFNYRHAPAIQQARHLIRSGELGRITNVRCWLIADYAADPRSPLTWRYERQRAGAGVIGDLMSHGADLVQYLCGRIEAVTAVSDTFIKERPIPTKMGVGHSGFEVGNDLGPVENEDYVAILALIENGVVATLESSRVSVGPRAEYVIEVYGTHGSVRWNFEHLNDLQVCIGRSHGANHGYARAMASPDFPYFDRFQPGAGTSMGFDDLKVIEAKLFIESVLSGQQLAPSVADGWAAAEIDEATVASTLDGQWHEVPAVAGEVTFNR